MIDIKKRPDVIEAINAILNSRGVAEIKWESKLGLTVVKQTRTILFPLKEDK